MLWYGSRHYDPALGRFTSPDTIIPGAGNPQAYDRYAYSFNNPVRYTDPTGHVPCDEEGFCYDHGRKYKAPTRQMDRLTKLRRELDNYEGESTYDENEMISVETGVKIKGLPSVINLSPEEYRLFLDKNGEFDTLKFRRFLFVSQLAVLNAESKFNYNGGNTPQNAFQHAYWNALMVKNFGLEFTEAYGNAHENINGAIREERFMDLHNNEIGRNIAKEYPGAPNEILIDLIFQELQQGNLVVWDGNDIYYSNQCSLCVYP